MATCKACDDLLILSLDPEDADSGDEGRQESETVPDDLELPCSCHFHWQCLLDQSSTILNTLQCPSCNTDLPTTPESSTSSSSQTTKPTIPTLYTNEGGPQPNLDILPILTEEAYLSSHPESRPARAMHTMVSEGDYNGIVSLLSDVDHDPEIDMTAAQLLHWTDPLNGGKSALHVAIESNQEEVFWLLLWLGSNLFSNVFPSPVVRAAGSMGLTRRDVVTREEDVRFVKDESNRTAADVCTAVGHPWTVFVEGGLFNES